MQNRIENIIKNNISLLSFEKYINTINKNNKDSLSGFNYHVSFYSTLFRLYFLKKIYPSYEKSFNLYCNIILDLEKKILNKEKDCIDNWIKFLYKNKDIEYLDYMTNILNLNKDTIDNLISILENN